MSALSVLFMMSILGFDKFGVQLV